MTKSGAVSRTALLGLLSVCLAAVVIVVILAISPAEDETEFVVGTTEVATPAEAEVHVATVVDATGDAELTAAEGQRYKVLIVDNAREGASGIARIGGLVTFVPETRQGDLVVIEVTRLRRSTADAIVIERLAADQPIPGRPTMPRRDAESVRARPAASQETAEAESFGMEGQVFRGTITDMGREGDGLLRIDGKVVFVEGSQVGEHVEFRITKDIGRLAFGEIVSRSDVPFEGENVIVADVADLTAPAAQEESASADASDAPAAAYPAADEQAVTYPVAVGEEYDVVISEKNRRSPDTDGVVRIEGLVVFVPGTQPGDEVRIRITDLRRRAADAVVIAQP
jgi:predicted RNA-binding protein with TRAM domain